MKLSAWTLAAALAAMMACGQAPASDQQMMSDGTAQTEQAATEQAIVYVDVRTQQEYDAGHVEDAIHIPHDQMEDRYAELQQYADQQIVVYCRSGRRSGIAQDVLEDQGFDNVTNGGGLQDLAAQGVPTTER